MRLNFSFNRQEDRRENIYVEYVNLETIYYIIIGQNEWDTLSYSTAGHGRVFGIRHVQTLREPSTRTGFWTSWYIETYLWLLMPRLLGREVWFHQAGKYVLLYEICIGVENVSHHLFLWHHKTDKLFHLVVYMVGSVCQVQYWVCGSWPSIW